MRNVRGGVAGVLLVVLVSSFEGAFAQTEAPAADPVDAASVSAAPETRTVTRYELPPDKLAKAEALYRTRTVLYLASLLVGIGILVFVAATRIGGRYRDLAERASARRSVQALIFIPLLLLTVALLGLPLEVYQQHIMRSYGLSVQGWGSWFWDWIKGQIIGLVITTPLVFGLYGIIRRSPRRWWLYFWLLTMPVLVFLVFLAPVVLDPMFNTFAPLHEKQPQLVEPLQRVVARGGLDIPRSRMFEMDASEKVTTYNAYVTGIGATKRVVVWDNTAREMTVPETLFVFGHEMGHYVLGHVYKTLIFASVMLLIAFWAGRRLVLWILARRGERWGIRDVADWASLPILLLALSLLTFIESPLFSAFSRSLERQADIYGLEITHGINDDSPQVAASAFQKLGEKALAYPDPHPLLVFWSFSHPTIADRISFALKYRPWETPEGPTYVR
ncbi:MAG TPA: M48 family metallopeptidase [Vicinamibacterales bacterium]|nr:M48 family metallopeptidase [Vicinamibacterales bacterium]